MAIAKGNDSRLAAKLLNRLPQPRSYAVYHAVISSCGRTSNPKLGMETFELMKADGVMPKRATYNAVLHSCSVNTFQPYPSTPVSTIPTPTPARR